jgi:hypothetical protein
MRARRAAVIAAVAALCGCPFHPRAPQPAPDRGDWARVRDEATRQFQLYDGLDHRATATATYLSPEVREARARRIAVWFAWSEAELQRRLADERAEAAQFDDFVLSFYTADRDSNDLDALRSVWRIEVDTGTGQIIARDVHALGADANLTALFPWVGPFDTVYLIRFPRAPTMPLAGRPFVLRLSSGLGQVVLNWGAPPKPIVVYRQAP